MTDKIRQSTPQAISNGATSSQQLRRYAHRALTLLSEDPSCFLSDIIARVIEEHQLDSRNSRLFSHIVYGVTRHRRRLSAILRSQLKQPDRTLPPHIELLLLSGIYQLVMLDRIPPYAILNDTVELTKKLPGGQKYAGFVNGVLRAVSRQPENAYAYNNLRQKLSAQDAQSPFDAIWSSVDNSFYRHVKNDYPTHVKEILSSLNQPTHIHLRTNTTQITPGKLREHLASLHIETIPGEYSPSCLRSVTNSRTPLLTSDLYANGAFRIQDESSQLIAPMLLSALLHANEPLDTQLRILDLCAGRGGKATHIAELTADTPNTTLYCYDIAQSKLDELSLAIDRLKLEQPKKLTDPKQEAPYDAILIDAPCTGTGVLRRHPESKWTWSEKNLAQLVLKQQKLLERGYHLLKPGGILIYAVCSMLKQEGADQIEYLTKRYSDCHVIQPTLPKSLTQHHSTRQYLSILPHEYDMDGFFAALVRKVG